MIGGGMKNLVIAVVIVVIGVGILLEGRYQLKIDSPVVAKLDKLTGDTWIANSGVWRKVKHEEPQGAPSRPHESTRVTR